MSKFLLLLGPSGVGKSAIIERLISMDSKFVYISPYMTRQLRTGETNKIPVSDERMDEMEKDGDLLAVNVLFGNIRYGTPRLPIEEALRSGAYPILDWPIERISIMTEAFAKRLFIVYVLPPSLEILRKRLELDGRDLSGARLEAAKRELRKYQAEYKLEGIYHLEVVSHESGLAEVASKILSSYLESLWI